MPLKIENWRINKANAFLPYIKGTTDLLIIIEQINLTEKPASTITVQNLFIEVNKIISEWIEKISLIDEARLREFINDYDKGIVEINSREQFEKFDKEVNLIRE
jgi:hypothetical protein